MASTPSGPLGGKGDDLVNVRSSRGKHQQAVDSERDTGAVGDSCGQCRQKVFIDRECWHAAPPPFLIVRCEALALLHARSELMIAVGELHAVPIELEALRRAGIVRVAARQSSLGGGISMNEGQPLPTEGGPDAQAHEKVE